MTNIQLEVHGGIKWQIRKKEEYKQKGVEKFTNKLID